MAAESLTGSDSLIYRLTGHTPSLPSICLLFPALLSPLPPFSSFLPSHPPSPLLLFLEDNAGPLVSPPDSAGLEQTIDDLMDHEIVKGILHQGVEVDEYALVVEKKLRDVELESIQDYITESDTLVELHDQIRRCDGILEVMEQMLGGFQHDLGNLSSEIKSLQEQSLTMKLKLRNRKVCAGPGVSKSMSQRRGRCGALSKYRAES